jgi:hypothetical protein
MTTATAQMKKLHKPKLSYNAGRWGMMVLSHWQGGWKFDDGKADIGASSYSIHMEGE